MQTFTNIFFLFTTTEASWDRSRSSASPLSRYRSTFRSQLRCWTNVDNDCRHSNVDSDSSTSTPSSFFCVGIRRWSSSSRPTSARSNCCDVVVLAATPRDAPSSRGTSRPEEDCSFCASYETFNNLKYLSHCLRVNHLLNWFSWLLKLSPKQYSVRG